MTEHNQVHKVALGAGEGLPSSHPRDDPGAPAGGEAFSAELDLFAGATVKARRTGPGRPAGSANRTTVMLQRWLISRGYRDPAEFLAAVISESTAELAVALGSSKLEALQQQLRAAADLMPYFHAKMPIAVDVNKSEAPRKLIVMGDLVMANLAGEPAPDQDPPALEDRRD